MMGWIILLLTTQVLLLFIMRRRVARIRRYTDVLIAELEAMARASDKTESQARHRQHEETLSSGK